MCVFSLNIDLHRNCEILCSHLSRWSRNSTLLSYESSCYILKPVTSDHPNVVSGGSELGEVLIRGLSRVIYETVGQKALTKLTYATSTRTLSMRRPGDEKHMMQ